MRIYLNQSKSGGISRVKDFSLEKTNHIINRLAYTTYKERSIWKKHQINCHLNII